MVRLQCFHWWGCVFELNFWQFFFSIFQLFLVLLSHVVCRNVYYNKPWHEGNGGLVVGAVHSKPHVRFEPCLSAIFHIFIWILLPPIFLFNFLWPNGFAQVHVLAVGLSKIKIFWCTKIPSNWLAQWLDWFCRKLRCRVLFPPTSNFVKFYPIIFLVWAEPRKVTNWT